MPVIFYLSREFLVYVWENEAARLVEKVQTGEEEKFLNLAENFQPLWEFLWENNLQNTQEIYFFSGPKAGFTDARIIYLWLQSWQMFSRLKGKKAQFYLLSSPKEIILESLNAETWTNLLKETKVEKEMLQYSGPIRIGTK